MDISKITPPHKCCENVLPTADNSQRLAFFDFVKCCCMICIIITHESWSNVERTELFFPFIIDMAVPSLMIVTGYMHARQYEHKKLKDMYALRDVIKKGLRLIVPFCIAYAVYAVPQILLNPDCSLKTLIYAFITGGLGPGGYYFPIMLQLIFLAPILFIKVKENKLYQIFLFNLFYEVGITTLGIDVGYYRLLIFRYSFLVALGMELKLKEVNLVSIGPVKCVFSLVIGVVYIYFTAYTEYQEKIFQQWTGTSMMCAFWIFPIFIYLLKKIKSIPRLKINMVGEASYHVFLVQMVYFSYKSILGMDFNIYLRCLINVIISVSVGIIFYYFEKPIQKFVKEKVGGYFS